MKFSVSFETALPEKKFSGKEIGKNRCKKNKN